MLSTSTDTVVFAIKIQQLGSLSVDMISKQLTHYISIKDDK